MTHSFSHNIDVKDIKRKLGFIEKLLETNSLSEIQRELDSYIDLKRQTFEKK